MEEHVETLSEEEDDRCQIETRSSSPKIVQDEKHEQQEDETIRAGYEENEIIGLLPIESINEQMNPLDESLKNSNINEEENPSCCIKFFVPSYSKDIVFATNNWTANVSVTKGEHLDIVDDYSGILFCLVKKTTTKEEGLIPTDIITRCPYHRNCGIAKTNFDSSLYATFMKGDRLIIDRRKDPKQGWPYGKREEMDDGWKQQRFKHTKHQVGQEGYIHPLWIQTLNSFLGFLAMRLFGLCLMIFDMIMDFINGIDYLGLYRPPLPSDDELICKDLNKYSHPVWGLTGIGLMWLPALPIVVNIISAAWKHYLLTKQLGYLIKRICFSILILITWPIASISMLLHSALHYFNSLCKYDKTKRIEWITAFTVIEEIGSLNITVKSLEAYLEAAFQMQLQLYVLYSGHRMGGIQFLSFATSLFSLVWNTMEWNWIGHSHDSFERIWNRIKLFPFFLVPACYKCISISVIVWYLKFYSLPAIGIIGMALSATYYIIRNNYGKQMTKHSPENHSTYTPVTMRYQLRNIFLILSNFSTLSLPRLPQNTLHFKDVEKTWYRWDSRVSFLGYSLCMALILLLRDQGLIFPAKCSVLVGDSAFIVSLITSIVILGILSILIVELYLKWGDHLLIRKISKGYQIENKSRLR